ncbi:hypothetical protein AB0F91_47100 [Amycolatopsis sp. NPDC023774]|uniref:hypothetical protein n=1 Tax=Amycolatopsis sp. NPDC023774 TaxID=3155015 RepID=UPI0033FA34F0
MAAWSCDVDAEPFAPELEIVAMRRRWMAQQPPHQPPLGESNELGTHREAPRMTREFVDF